MHTAADKPGLESQLPHVLPEDHQGPLQSRVRNIGFPGHHQGSLLSSQEREQFGLILNEERINLEFSLYSKPVTTFKSYGDKNYFKKTHFYILLQTILIPSVEVNIYTSIKI